LQECTKLTNDNTEHESEIQKLSAEREKDAADRSRLETENASVSEEKKKLLQMIQNARQKLLAHRTDKERLESKCSDLERQIEAERTERESARPPGTEPTTGMCELELCTGTETKQSRYQEL